MAAGLQVFAPDGSLQLDNTTKIIANPTMFGNYVITSTRDYRWVTGGGCLNCSTYAYLHIENYSSIAAFDIDKHLFAFRPAEGKTFTVNNFGGVYGFSTTEDKGANYGKYALIPIEYQPPNANANDNLLVVFDEAGKAVWSIEDFVKSPQVIDFANIAIPSGVKMLNMSPLYFEVPASVDMDKVFVIPLPEIAYSWDQVQTEGLYWTTNVAVTRIGRRFYVMPYDVSSYANMTSSSVDPHNRSEYEPGTRFTTGVDLLVVYIANAPP